jgi:hypothetical protein
MRTRIIPNRWLARPVMAAATTLALAAGTAATVLTGPAAHAATGLSNVVVVQSAPSASNSTSPKVATAICPRSYSVIGVGGAISGGAGKVALEQVLPDLNTRSVQVTGAETDPTPRNWSVRAKAICAPRPGGLVEKVWQSASTSDDKEQTVNCPAGKTLLGIGYAVLNGGGQVVVTEALPVDGGTFSPATKVTAAAHEQDGTTADWRLVVRLLCANPIANQMVISATESIGTAKSKSVETGSCTLNNQHATGGGFDVESNPAGLDGEFAVTSFGPVMLKFPVLPPPFRFRGTVYKEDGTSSDAGITIQTLCA